MTLSKLHRCLGHISPGAAGDIVRLGMIGGIDLDMHSKAEFLRAMCTSRGHSETLPEEEPN